mgnify:CR=1 FL=1
MRTVIDNHPATDTLKADLAAIEERVVTGYTLADAIREGSKVTEQANGAYRMGNNVCALSAGLISAKARGYVK